MSVITAFDSDRPSEKVQLSRSNYQDVLKAVSLVGVEGAAAILARVAKRDLHSLLCPVVMMTSAEAHEAGVYPLWFSSISVVLDLDKADPKDPKMVEKMATSLAKGVEGMAELVNKISKEEPSHELVVADPLRVQIQAVGVTLLRFDFKQKWGWR